jgi:hypothetical protein
MKVPIARNTQRAYSQAVRESATSARKRTARLGDERWVRQKFPGNEAMHREAPGIEALVIGDSRSIVVRLSVEEP